MVVVVVVIDNCGCGGDDEGSGGVGGVDVVHVDANDDGYAEYVEESSFILSRLATTTSCSRSNSKVCACDAGYKQ